MTLTPSPEQQAVLDLGPDTIRIRAGAGTGKTTTIGMAIANLVRVNDVEPERILGITFTNKAAAELTETIRGRLGGVVDEGRSVEIHTYHGFAAQILAEFGSLAGLEQRPRIITPTFSRQLLAETFHHTRYQHIDITVARSLDKIRTLGDRLSDHLHTPDELHTAVDPDDETWQVREEMLETLERYGEDKRRLGAVDYGDLVTLSTRLMQTFPDLAAEVRGRYQVVVLDEYQDTNPAQRVLLTTLFGDGFPVIAVGDEDQTIYEWRGASAENFELFTSHFQRPDGGPVHDLGLTLNRRSAPVLLEVANQVRRLANPQADDLVAADPTKRGEVVCKWAEDAVVEANWIADQFRRLHDDGKPWREMAVLFRKNKDFAVVVDAMRRADIPVEVANLGGLLSVPEVAELRAWLTVVERPGDSAAVTQILFGSRYRLGLADLAPLTRWVSDAEPGIDDEDVPGVTLLEALEHLDEIDAIRDDARTALGHFVDTYRAVLTESQGASLVETCRLLLDRTRAWHDIEALPRNQRLTARLNLYRLLDLAEDWSPLRGRPSIGAFLEYLDAMEDEPAEELDSAHLSGEDAVTLVTVHRAKGLEWDAVSIPAVVDQNFPSRARQHPDPIKFPEYLPVEYRIDDSQDDMPLDDKARTAYFKRRNELQEWRVAYVACTRARELLMVSGAYWYGLPEPTVNAKKPSPLFDLVANHPATNHAGEAEEPPRPEILGHGEAGIAPDPLFSDGWDGAMRTSIVDPDHPRRLAATMGVESQYGSRVNELTDKLFSLSEVEGAPAEAEDRVVSVTGLVTYAQCPKRFFWTEIDPLPRRRNPAAIAGTELHRRIELYQRGQVPFEEVAAELYDTPEEGSEPGGFAAFEKSRFADSDARLVEAPFSLQVGHQTRVRGRIDAVYVDSDHWEIVDFKSGKPQDTESRIVQLEAYAMAARDVDFGIAAPDTMDVTFAYLGGGLVEETYRADEPWLQSAREHVEGIVGSIADGDFGEAPADHCRHCDFLQFCEPGKAFMSDR